MAELEASFTEDEVFTALFGFSGDKVSRVDVFPKTF